MPAPQWPEQFVYVCAATQGAIVNTLPIVYAGIGRVARVYVLCGASGPETQDERALREAVNPTARLVGFVSDRARKDSIEPPQVKPLYGDSEEFAVWRTHMRTILSESDTAHLPVVLALTGGRKPMTIGTMHAIGAEDSERLRLVNVRGHPLRVEFVDTSLRQTPAPKDGRLSLDEYLAVYGVLEKDVDDRRAQEESYRGMREALAGAAEACLRGPPWRINALNEMVDKRCFRVGERFEPGALKPANELANILSAFSGLGGIEALQDGQFAVTTETAGRLLRGGWLEAYIFNRIEELAQGRNDVEIRANMRLTHRQDDSGEIDLALYVGEQLHIVEAKTQGFGGKRTGEKALSQIETLKRLFQAQYGRTWVVNPTTTRQRLDEGRGDFIPRAESAGIALLLGPRAVNKLVAEIQKLL
jgi:hypothetical protein